MIAINKWLITTCIVFILHNNIDVHGIQVLQTPSDFFESDVELLAKLINSESGTEDLLDKLMVGSVVLNRMRVSNQSMQEVIYKPNMFSGINTEGFIVKDESETAAIFLLRNGPIDTTVMYFLNPTISTNRRWVDKVMKRELVLKSDNHYFYK